MEEQSQKVTIVRIVRTIDEDGKTIDISTINIPAVAVIDEYKKIQLDVAGVERYTIGDVKFMFLPTVVITQYDKILWNNRSYVIKNIKDPTRVAGVYLYFLVEAGREDLG